MSNNSESSVKDLESNKKENPFTPLTAKDMERYETSIVKIMKVSDFIVENNDTSLSDRSRLGFYSVKINKKEKAPRSYSADGSQLRCLKDTPDNLDKITFEYIFSEDIRAIQWDEEQGGIDEILRWILDNPSKISSSSNGGLNPHFICSQGALAKIMMTPPPLEDPLPFEAWMFIVVKINGTIYFHQIKTNAIHQIKTNACKPSDDMNENADKPSDDMNENAHKPSDDMNEMIFSGLWYEEQVTKRAGIGAAESGIEEGLLGQSWFVLQAKLNSHYLVYAAEIDCVNNPSLPLSRIDEMELYEVKTIASHKAYPSEDFRQFYEDKWLCKACLSDVDIIYSGYRQKKPDGKIFFKGIQEIKTKSLIEENAKKPWSIGRRLNFLDQFLKFVKDSVTIEKRCYKIYCSEDRKITLSETTIPVDKIIPQRFIDKLSENRSK